MAFWGATAARPASPENRQFSGRFNVQIASYRASAFALSPAAASRAAGSATGRPGASRGPSRGVPPSAAPLRRPPSRYGSGLRPPRPPEERRGWRAAWPARGPIRASPERRASKSRQRAPAPFSLANASRSAASDASPGMASKSSRVPSRRASGHRGTGRESAPALPSRPCGSCDTGPGLGGDARLRVGHELPQPLGHFGPLLRIGGEAGDVQFENVERLVVLAVVIGLKLANASSGVMAGFGSPARALPISARTTPIVARCFIAIAPKGYGAVGRRQHAVGGERSMQSADGRHRQ